MISKTEVKEYITVGTGRNKKDLIHVHLKHDIPAGDADPLGLHLKHATETGSTSDDTFGLKLVSLQATATCKTVALATRSMGFAVAVGTVSTSDEETAAYAIHNPKVISVIGHSEPMRNDMNCRQPVYLGQKFDPDYQRVFVLPEVQVSTFFSAQNTEGWVLSVRATFEKVKVTKQEYLEKMLRNI